MIPESRQQWLVLLLRCAGSFLLVATLAIFLPTEWMRYLHDLMKIGPFPESTITEYLTRSVAAMYAVHGGLMWMVSRDVVRHQPIVTYLGVSNILLGIFLLGIDLFAGMPWYWTVGEGPPIAGMGCLLLYCNRPSEVGQV